MSGGIAYVLDSDGSFASRCNPEMVQLGPLKDLIETEMVKDMVFRHAQYTGSKVATDVLIAWDEWLPKFVRVIPNDYKRILDVQKELKDTGMSDEDAEMAAFELNSQDVARVGGK
jgi:glutamate synthase (ferredoxin)